jgi:serine-type D-Ala-D-Ala carboxypeptidase/endopeptidase (penicillin-binding protein 4)
MTLMSPAARNAGLSGNTRLPRNIGSSRNTSLSWKTLLSWNTSLFQKTILPGNIFLSSAAFFRKTGVTCRVVTGVLLLWAAALPVQASETGPVVSGPVASESMASMDVLRQIAPGDRAILARAAQDKKAGILVTDDTGTVLFSQNPDTFMVPASILKILTSLAALTHLGPDFHFTTLAAHDPDTHTLYARGQGDPLFVSEAILSFCRRFKEKTGVKEIRKIVVDQSFFAQNIQIPGTGRSLNPYDATIGALCANFNTIHFTWDAAAQTHVSAEAQSPLLDIFTGQIRKTGLKRGRILVEKQVRPLYPGLLMAHFFKTLGVAVTGPVELGPFPAYARTDGTAQMSDTPDTLDTLDTPNALDNQEIRTLALSSPYSLEQVVEKLLTHSNNFIANQVMLAMGARTFGEPAILDKGVRVLTDFARKELGWQQMQLVEGSGLSRKNRVTAAQMGKLLQAFMPLHRLLKRTGTQYYKTGTLSDVKSRAGYFLGKDNRLYPFVIIHNA